MGPRPFVVLQSPVCGAQGLCICKTRSLASWDSGRAARRPLCTHGGRRVRVYVLIFLGPSAMNVSAGMFWCCTKGGHICLGTIQAPFPFHRAGVFIPCASCKQPNKQTNKHMGTQTPYYHHTADAAWFGLYFSRCHSNGKPGSKSKYPLQCSTPPYGKIIVTVRKAWSASLLLLPNPSSAEALRRPVTCLSEPRGDDRPPLQGAREHHLRRDQQSPLFPALVALSPTGGCLGLINVQPLWSQLSWLLTK